MKMIRNKNEAVSARPLLILVIGPVLIGAVRRTCKIAGEALALRLRFAWMRARAISRSAA